MSHETTNVEKQAKRHWGPLAGFAFIGVFVAVLTLYIVGGDPDQVVEDQAGPELVSE